MGERLRQLRKQANLQQEELAVLAGVSVSLIAKYERGEIANPGVVSVKDIAHALATRLPLTVNKILTELLGEVTA